MARENPEEWVDIDALTGKGSEEEVLAAPDEAAARRAADDDARAARVEELYGVDVIPPGVRAVLNAGFTRWVHVVPPGKDME